MVEIHPGLFVGNQEDYEQQVRFQRGWRVIHACREPYHRAALGYRGRSAPKDHPEYLVADRGDRLILNLIDADDPAYVPREIMDRSLDFIRRSLGDGRRVLVHCNQGLSRAPSIGMLYLAAHTSMFSGLDHREAHGRFLELYQDYYPRAGLRGFLATNWTSYCQGHGRDGADGISGPDEEAGVT